VRGAELVLEELDLGHEVVDAFAHVLTTLIELQDLAVEEAEALVAILEESSQADVLADGLAVAIDERDHDPFETIEVGFRSRLAGRGR
jgi:hypothetical protein